MKYILRKRIKVVKVKHSYLKNNHKMNQYFYRKFHKITRKEYFEKHGVKLMPKSPLKELKSRGIMAFDLETKDGLLRQKMYCWSIAFRDNHGNIETYSYIPKDRNYGFWKLLEICKSNDNHFRTIFVHNLSFEAGFLIDFFVRNKINFLPILSSNFIAISLPEYKCKFVDSMQFLQSSQEEAEKEFGIEEKYTKINCNEIFNKKYFLWSENDKQKVFEHNKNDVIALLLIMIQFRQDIFDNFQVDVLNSISLASCSLSAFRVCLEKPIANPFITTKFNYKTGKLEYRYEQKEEEFVRQSYFGGRTEVFNSAKQFQIAILDKVSMYPFRMKYFKYPSGFGQWNNNIKELKAMIKSTNDTIAGFIEVDVIPPKNLFYPILPYRIDGKVQYTNCQFHGIYTLIELQYAYQNGYILIPKKGFIYDSVENYFDKFISKAFTLKMNNIGGKALSPKIMMNGLSGKFGQKIKQKASRYHFFNSLEESQNFEMQFEDYDGLVSKTIEMNDGLFYLPETYESIRMKPYMNVALSSYIVAGGRIELHKKLMSLYNKSIKAFMSDTDSIAIESMALAYNRIAYLDDLMDNENEFLQYYDIENLREEFDIGKELTQWKIEEYIDEVIFLAPKSYIKLQNGHIEMKMKGLNKRNKKQLCDSNKSIDELIKELNNGIELEERYESFKESLRDGNLLSTKQMIKHFTFTNEKRNFDKHGNSKSWTNETLRQFVEQKVIAEYNAKYRKYNLERKRFKPKSIEVLKEKANAIYQSYNLLSILV